MSFHQYMTSYNSRWWTEDFVTTVFLFRDNFFS